MEGKIYSLDYPVVSEEMLISSVNLLREYHDVSEKFIKSNSVQKDGWVFKALSPIQVICHNDFAPYNICYRETQAVGLIDFETIAPGPRIWDIAYALYRFAPFMASIKHEDFGTVDEQIKRARLFCDAYSLKQDEREGLADIIINRLEALLDFIIKSAKKDNAKYIEAIKEGHHTKYMNDIEYIRLNKHYIDKNLIKELK